MSNLVTAEGWAMFESGPAATVEIWLGDEHRGHARLGLARPDIVVATADPRGVASGFAQTVDVRNGDSGEGSTLLRAVATSVTGERCELEPVEITIAASTEPLPPRPPARVSRARRPSTRDGHRMLICTHQLDPGGAQSFLVHLVRGLTRLGGFEMTVLSAANGALRTEFEALDVPVHVSTGLPIDELDAHLGRVEELTAWGAERDFDLVFINTASAMAFPGAEVATRLGIPAVWAIHESYPPSILWMKLDPDIRALAETELANATAAIFEARATQRLYEPLIGPERCLTLPYGLDVDPIDEQRAGFDRAAARAAAGIATDAEVILCAGSVEPRKGQVPLAQAFDLIAADHPQARLVFVGGRENSDSRQLGEWVASLSSAERIELLPMTPEVQTWYGLSDVLVCASDIESLPRAVLEAMAWELPVLTTSVFGLPELIDEGRTGWLCPPRDVSALASALDRVLNTPPTERSVIGRAGGAHVRERHSLDRYCRQVIRLLDQAVEEAGRLPTVPAVGG